MAALNRLRTKTRRNSPFFLSAFGGTAHAVPFSYAAKGSRPRRTLCGLLSQRPADGSNVACLVVENCQAKLTSA